MGVVTERPRKEMPLQHVRGVIVSSITCLRRATLWLTYLSSCASFVYQVQRMCLSLRMREGL
jgi:hypothetical protein